MSSIPWRRLRGARLMLAGIPALLAAVVAIAALSSPAAHSAASPARATVNTRQPVYLEHAGQTATVGFVLTTAGASPLSSPVTVNYATGATLTVGNGALVHHLPSTAEPGTDYQPASGSITFPAGTPSGAVMTVAVHTLAHSAAAQAKTINISLTSADPTVSVTPDPPTVVIDAHGFAYLNSSLPIKQRVADLLSRMSLAEKVGEMTQADRYMFTNPDTTSGNSPNELRAWYVGSLLSGAGDTPTPNTPQGWADMVDGFQARALSTPLQIPLIYGEDSVHGDGNMIGATVFPHNIGMGATRDPALATSEGQVAAAETRATGPQWAFAPCLCVARDDRWGRTYESFGEDPALVTRMETVIDGFQGNHPQAGRSADSSLNSNHAVLATAKHYAGDGGTAYGTGDNGYPIDQGIDKGYTASQFYKLFLSPYLPAVQRHQVGSVMPSYSSVQLQGMSCPVKMSANKQLLTGVLKQEMGFSGFLISDYNAAQEIGDARSCPIPSPLPAGYPGKFGYQIGTSALAGMDMFMMPSAYRETETDLNTMGANGTVPMSRIDDAVSRILTQKFELGLFEHPFTDRSGQAAIGGGAHRAVAARAAAESQVLLKNAHHVLPLSSQQRIYVAGSNADNLGAQTGGWTLSWQGQPGPLPDPGTTILSAIKARDANVTYSPTASAPTVGRDVGVVVVGEHPYAEGQGDVGFNSYPSNNGNISSLDLTRADHAAVDTVCHAMPCVVLIVSGRPMTISSQLGEIDGLVASWLPGTEGEGVASVLFGATPFRGQLPQSWPRSLSQEPINVADANYNPQFPFGWGLHDTSTRSDAQRAMGALGSGHAASTRLRSLLASANTWTSGGEARRPASVLAALGRAAAALPAGAFSQAELVVAVARDIAQAAILAHGGPGAHSSKLFALADDALLSGHPARAVALLGAAAGA